MIMFVICINSIGEEFEKETYTHANMQVLAIQHGLQGRVAHSQLARNAEFPVTVQRLFYLGLIQGQWSSFCNLVIYQIFQHLLILSDQSTAAVIAQNAKENILIVGEMSTFSIESI